MPDFYKLNEDKTISSCTADEWGKQMELMCTTETKHVSDEIVNGKRISTVWLGLDHGFPRWSGHTENYRPLVFETMVFNEGSGMDIYCDRYSTWEEAEEGHKKAVEWVVNGCSKDNANYGA